MDVVGRCGCGEEASRGGEQIGVGLSLVLSGVGCRRVESSLWSGVEACRVGWGGIGSSGVEQSRVELSFVLSRVE